MRKGSTNGERGRKPIEAMEARLESCCRDGREFNMKEMMRACPCGNTLKRHRVAVYTSLVGIGLGLLVIPAGWLLGVIAFFRTF